MSARAFSRILVAVDDSPAALAAVDVGDVTRGVLEFSDTPVLVVPRRA